MSQLPRFEVPHRYARSFEIAHGNPAAIRTNGRPLHTRLLPKLDVVRRIVVRIAHLIDPNGGRRTIRGRQPGSVLAQSAVIEVPSFSNHLGRAQLNFISLNTRNAPHWPAHDPAAPTSDDISAFRCEDRGKA